MRAQMPLDLSPPNMSVFAVALPAPHGDVPPLLAAPAGSWQDASATATGWMRRHEIEPGRLVMVAVLDGRNREIARIAPDGTVMASGGCGPIPGAVLHLPPGIGPVNIHAGGGL